MARAKSVGPRTGTEYARLLEREQRLHARHEGRHPDFPRSTHLLDALHAGQPVTVPGWKLSPQAARGRASTMFHVFPDGSVKVADDD
ncbi:hypothetical protein [Rhodococcus sp. NPDC055024]